MIVSKYLKLIIACAMATAITLTACAQQAQTPAANTKPEPSKYGGTLKIGLPAAPTSLDSFVMVTGPAGTIWKAYGLTLVRWVGKNDREATVAPCLAKTWELSPDGFTYTFHLQEGIKWQNTPLMKGREFTADDLAYFYGRVNDPANRYQSRPNLDIKSFEAVDKYTFKITNNNKNPGFMAYMAHGAGIVQPKEAVEAPGGVEKNWAGAGPFILTDYEKESKAILKKNSDYFDTGRPYL